MTNVLPAAQGAETNVPFTTECHCEIESGSSEDEVNLICLLCFFLYLITQLIVTSLDYNKSPLGMSPVSCTPPSRPWTREESRLMFRHGSVQFRRAGLVTSSDTETRPSSKGIGSYPPAPASHLHRTGKPARPHTMVKASVSELSPCPGPGAGLVLESGLKK